MDKIALISGANRGLGLEIGKQLLEIGWNVVFTARNMHEGRPLVNKLRETWKTAWYHQLDVTDEQSIIDVADYVEDTCGRLDVLINNAGILIEENHRAMDMELEDLHKTMATNFYGPLMLTRTMVPSFKESKDARVINISSRMGQLSGMGGWTRSLPDLQGSTECTDGYTGQGTGRGGDQGKYHVSRLGMHILGRAQC
jgi:NAD(P)-dependent dehydrogenase (short-subunit alcohol dehydrogenase family)